MLTNVQKENTIAVLTLCATIPRDLTTAPVIRDIMGMGDIMGMARIVIKVNLIFVNVNFVTSKRKTVRGLLETTYSIEFYC